MTVDNNGTEDDMIVKVNEIAVRDYVTMNEILKGKGGAHRNKRKERNKRKCRGRVRGEE